MARILKGAQLIDGNWVVSANPAPPVELLEGEEPEPTPPPIDTEALLAKAMASAQREAEKLIEAARVEAETIRETARQEGYAAGRAQGETEGKQAWLSKVQEVAAGAQSHVDDRKAMLQEVEADVVRLALITAERILQREARSREAVVSLIHGALSQLGDETVLRLRVHPSDLAGLAGYLDMPHGEIKPDASVGLGGVVFETHAGKVDARFVTQFRELAYAVLMADPEEDPLLAPSVQALQSSLESKVPAAESAWKPV